MVARFSTNSIVPSIIAPLRYYFSTYTGSSNLFWNEDENLRTMDISESYDDNKTPLGEKPRVIVSRGNFDIRKTGLTNNMAQSGTNPIPGAKLGNLDLTNFVIYAGMASVLIEARNKGTCELLSDMVMHFIVWTRPILCDEGCWKEFGLPMNVTDCSYIPNEDPNITKFQVQLSVPWMKEELWSVRDEGPELRAVIQSVTNSQ